MKAISIKQPWASLIANGIKNIENRTWRLPEKYKGQRVLIHAGLDKKLHPDLSMEQHNALYKYYMGIGTQPKKYGFIIGSVELVDCVINHPSIWAEKSTAENYVYNWVLASPLLFPDPIPAKGKLSFWDYPNLDSYEDDLTGEKVCLCRLDLSGGGELRCKYCGGLIETI